MVELFSIDLKTNKPNYVLLSDPFFQAVTFNERFKKLYSLISPEKRKTIHVLSETRDGNQLILALSENEDAFRYYRIDARKNTSKPIGEYVFA